MVEVGYRYRFFGLDAEATSKVSLISSSSSLLLFIKLIMGLTSCLLP